MPARMRPRAKSRAKPDTEPDLLEPSVPDEVVDEVYEEIRAMQRGAGVDLAIRMGKLIVEKFYRGDLSKWHERGQKDASLRRSRRGWRRAGTRA